MSSITVQNITMKFKEVTALDNISVTFKSNKIYGLLGRNGAGKSTLLNLITNKIFPTNGAILIDGVPVLENERALKKVYCMSERTLYPDTLRVKEVFKWSKEFYIDFDMKYAYKLAEKFALNTKQRIKNLSTGYSSIFKIVVALASNVPIILLDEPVLGLDANHRELFYRELIENYAEKPRTVIISTHLIEEVADLIEEVVIIKDGKILIENSAESVKATGYGVTGKASEVEKFIEGKNVLSVESLGGLKTAYLYGEAPKLMPEALEISGLDLQKLFIQLTN